MDIEIFTGEINNFKNCMKQKKGEFLVKNKFVEIKKINNQIKKKGC